ncbi:MAG: tripartite tricarboxylate transporter permease [Deltaproteobacteria bacterium]|nr:tripartite tricarboxylate transporter permease [Deltaproteobacteria bacterium]
MGMLEPFMLGLTHLLIPANFFFLIIGILSGLTLGVIPGLGGLVGLSIFLPFSFTLDPFQSFAFMIGLTSITCTSDTIPAVLISVPGTAASMATILDGYPMAKRGEAGRALGAAYMASMLGGIVGAVVLFFSIPIIRTIIFLFGAPELFMLTILGLSMVGAISGNEPIKGLLVGGFGLFLGMVGLDPRMGVERWTFGQLYLWDGLPLIPIGLGIFALPEIGDLVIRGTKIAEVPKEVMKGASIGVRDVFKNYFLMIRSAIIGTWIGAIPGLGGAVADWVSYGHALQTEKGATNTFGKGDVRGVIASETSNNAKEGGALIPTLAFGVPGSASMALILGGFMIQGITPGPDMLSKHLDLTFLMVWSIIFANIMGAGICLVLTKWIAKLCFINVHRLMPPILVAVFLASFQMKRSLGDLIVLLSVGSLGWLMKRFDWPRPPLILGFILSRIAENYFFISLDRYGPEFFLRPIVLIISVIILVTLYYGLRQKKTEDAIKKKLLK